ncbi:hypothetical protein [Pseudoruegeria sp. HB172150]|nr:hypothetical protein [Pseudoruegeria sp. HB172150]
MSNRVAIGLGLCIIAFLVYDATMRDWEMSLYLGRKGMDFIEYLAFWR